MIQIIQNPPSLTMKVERTRDELLSLLLETIALTPVWYLIVEHLFLMNAGLPGKMFIGNVGEVMQGVSVDQQSFIEFADIGQLNKNGLR